MSSRAQVDDLSSQLEVADKQLKSTRAFLEEQAGERETEREEWERKVARLQEEAEREAAGRRASEKEEPEDEGGSDVVEEDVEVEDSERDVGELRQELGAAVDKIYDLREIIRTLEVQLDVMSQTERGHEVRLWCLQN